MATEIELTKTMTFAKGEHIALKLRGQTFMNFYVNVCPCGGSWQVNIGTMRPDTSERELMEMVLYVMATMI